MDEEAMSQSSPLLKPLNDTGGDPYEEPDDEQEPGLCGCTCTSNSKRGKGPRFGRGGVKNTVWCIVFVIWLILIGGIVAAGICLSLLSKGHQDKDHKGPVPSPHFNMICGDYCKISIVESIPENLTYPEGSPSHLSTYDSWVWLLEEANETVDIASYYWTLRGSDDISDPTDKEGEDIYNKLIETHSRGVKIRVVQTPPSSTHPNKDTSDLESQGVIELRSLDMEKLIGSGIIHTKLWIVDGVHFYIGSANMDWRSLTQVKELGLLGENCSCITEDVQKIFEVFWLASDMDSLPPSWPDDLTAGTNVTDPALITVNGTLSQVYWTYRTDDITGILDIISKAEKFIYIAVMDYYPAVIYTTPKKYWPVIDDALRTAAYERGIQVRLMASYWPSTSPDMTTFLKSLGTWENSTGPYEGSITTKYFIVPKLTNRTIPYTRVNHNKYMVTDNAALISTSNWSGDYFISTGGISCVMNGTSFYTDSNNDGLSFLAVQDQLRLIFERDWDSIYTVDVSQVK